MSRTRSMRRKLALVAAGRSELESLALSSNDPETRAERDRIVGHVRDFARQVGDDNLDRVWAFLLNERKCYVAEGDGLSVLMACVDNWNALEETEAEEPPPSSGSSKFPFNQDSANFYEPEKKC